MKIKTNRILKLLFQVADKLFFLPCKIYAPDISLEKLKHTFAIREYLFAREEFTFAKSGIILTKIEINLCKREICFFKM